MRSLVVEDDFLCRRVLFTMLNKYGECDIAVHGREALAAYSMAVAEQRPYDLICLDVIMPTMNGQDTLMELRAYEEFMMVEKPVKILMTTGVSFSERVIHSFRMQSDGYLTKPIRKEEMQAALVKLGLITEVI